MLLLKKPLRLSQLLKNQNLKLMPLLRLKLKLRQVHQKRRMPVNQD
jgi:hypothetical protein